MCICNLCTGREPTFASGGIIKNPPMVIFTGGREYIIPIVKPSAGDDDDR